MDYYKALEAMNNKVGTLDSAVDTFNKLGFFLADDGRKVVRDNVEISPADRGCGYHVRVFTKKFPELRVTESTSFYSTLRGVLDSL